MVTVVYFTVVTFSSVGYGDLSFVSTSEKVIGCVFMLFGTTFLAILLTQAMVILNSLTENVSVEDSSFHLHNWVTLLSRFNQNTPLPESLYKQIK
jgi:hypothetical protein